MSKHMVLCGLLAASLLMLVVAGCGQSTEVSKSSFEKIEIGMTLSQVQGILGKGEVQVGTAGGLLSSAEVYTWTQGEKNIAITFVNGKVKTKMQSGL